MVAKTETEGQFDDFLKFLFGALAPPVVDWRYRLGNGSATWLGSGYPRGYLSFLRSPLLIQPQ